MANKQKSKAPKTPKNVQRKVVGMKRPAGMSKIDWRFLAPIIAKVEKSNVSK